MGCTCCTECCSREEKEKGQFPWYAKTLQESQIESKKKSWSTETEKNDHQDDNNQNDNKPNSAEEVAASTNSQIRQRWSYQRNFIQDPGACVSSSSSSSSSSR